MEVVFIGRVARVGEEEHHVDLVVGDASADLLAAAVLVGQEEGDIQAGGLFDDIPGGVGGAEGMLGQNTAVSYSELRHQLLFFVVSHQCDIHGRSHSSLSITLR